MMKRNLEKETFFKSNSWHNNMVLKVNEEFVTKSNFKGRGGKEQEILSCFKNNLIRQNGDLFDCRDTDSNEKYELKKQRDDQWFDPRKYSNLSDEEKKIIIIFLLIDKTGYCDMIATVNLDDFVNNNFNAEYLLDAYNYKQKHPKDQIKSNIKVREFIKNNHDIVQIIWKRNRV